ncbi:MAG TPA: protein kinase [Polyangiaceae bacterium]
MVDVGDALAGKYKVERMLGKGGMGYVVAARHMQLEQPVAIKILIPELCENEEAVARFLREARASVRIQSEHVARVLDVGTLDDGAPYMVMEFLEGRDLARELEDRERLPVSEAVDYLLQACEALAEAHALGIIHRDLKPANLFRTRRSDGSALIKVLDFGISKAIAVDAQPAIVTLTNTQGLIGSPFYMSPEQVRRPKTVDRRSDIWSLGIILHEFLSGAPPFVSDTPMSILAAVVTDTPPDLRTIRSDVPEGLQGVILRCLDKEAHRRFKDVVELATALKPYAPLTGAAAVARISAIVRSAKERALGASEPRHGGDIPTLDSSSPAVDTPTLESPRHSVQDELKHTDAGWGHSQSIASRSRRRLVLAGAVATLGILSFGWYVVRSRTARSAEVLLDIDRTSGSPRPELAPAARSPEVQLDAESLRAEGTPAAMNTASASGDAEAPHATPPEPARSAAFAVPHSSRPMGAKKLKGAPSSEKTPPVGAPATTPTTPGVDPLDGRR